MVFDEIDAGVRRLGCVQIGRRLARWRRTHRVIGHHLPQVAAYAVCAMVQRDNCQRCAAPDQRGSGGRLARMLAEAGDSTVVSAHASYSDAQGSRGY